MLRVSDEDREDKRENVTLHDTSHKQIKTSERERYRHIIYIHTYMNVCTYVYIQYTYIHTYPRRIFFYLDKKKATKLYLYNMSLFLFTYLLNRR